MLKVVFTINHSSRLGGSENILWALLRQVDRARLEPTVVFFGPGPFEREVAGLGVRTHVLAPGRLRQVHRLAANVVRLAAILRRERPDLVVNWLTKTQFYGGPAALLAGMRKRNVWWQFDFPNGRLAERLATLLPTRAVIACSEAVAVEQRALRPRREVLTVLPGIDDPGRLDDDRVAALRSRLAIPPGRTVAGIVGRLIPWKGQHRFLEALARLRADGHDVHGLVVGGDAYGLAPDYALYLPRLALELGIADHVTFTGHVPDAGAYIRQMNVLVNASAREPFGIVLLEAMALDVPVVAVDAGGPREIVEHGRSGMLARDASPAALVDAIGPLLADPGLRSRLAASGVALVAERFTARRMTADVERRLTELTARRA